MIRHIPYALLHKYWKRYIYLVVVEPSIYLPHPWPPHGCCCSQHAISRRGRLLNHWTIEPMNQKVDQCRTYISNRQWYFIVKALLRRNCPSIPKVYKGMSLGAVVWGFIINRRFLVQHKIWRDLENPGRYIILISDAKSNGACDQRTDLVLPLKNVSRQKNHHLIDAEKVFWSSIRRKLRQISKRYLFFPLRREKTRFLQFLTSFVAFNSLPFIEN